jgi:YidC/Oxa1 family membrane protein insertase
MRDIIDGYFNLVEAVLLSSHWLLGRVFAPDSGWTWAGAFVLLALSFQVAMFPLSIHQIRGDLAMRRLRPRIAELQREYEHDRKRLVEEQKRLWNETGTNPLTGCLLVLVKGLVLFSFIALSFNTNKDSEPLLSGEANRSFSDSSILGAPLRSSLTDSIPAGAVLMAVVLAAIVVGAEFLTRLRLTRIRMPSDSGGSEVQQETFLLYAIPSMWAIALFVAPLCSLFLFAAWHLWDLTLQSLVVRNHEPLN